MFFQYGTLKHKEAITPQYITDILNNDQIDGLDENNLISNVLQYGTLKHKEAITLQYITGILNDGTISIDIGCDLISNVLQHGTLKHKEAITPQYITGILNNDQIDGLDKNNLISNVLQYGTLKHKEAITLQHTTDILSKNVIDDQKKCCLIQNLLLESICSALDKDKDKVELFLLNDSNNIYQKKLNTYTRQIRKQYNINSGDDFKDFMSKDIGFYEKVKDFLKKVANLILGALGKEKYLTREEGETFVKKLSQEMKPNLQL